MAKTKVATVTRQLSLSERLAHMADHKATSLGITTPEYFRYLVIQDNQGPQPQPSEHISERAEQKYLADILAFLEEDKNHPRPEARSADELLHQLGHV